MGRILQDNYPEIVKRTFIVNGEYFDNMLTEEVGYHIGQCTYCEDAEGFAIFDAL